MPKRGVPISGECRELVIKVQDYFERECQNGGPLLPVSQVQLRLSQALGISVKTISRINKEKFGASGSEENVLKTPVRRRSKPITGVNSFDADAIRNHIYNYYMLHEYPTRRLLLVSLKEAGLFRGGKTALSKVLNDLGFEFTQRNKRKILIESDDLVLETKRNNGKNRESSSASNSE